MIKIKVLLCSVALTLLAFTSTQAVDFKIGSEGTLTIDVVNPAIEKDPDEVLMSNSDPTSDDTSFVGYAPYLDPVLDNVGSIYPPITWLEPNYRPLLNDAERYSENIFGNLAFVKISLAEPTRHEFGNTGIPNTNRLDTTGIPSNFPSAQATSVASRHGVPDPALMILVGTGLIGLAGYGKRKFKR